MRPRKPPYHRSLLRPRKPPHHRSLLRPRNPPHRPNLLRSLDTGVTAADMEHGYMMANTQIDWGTSDRTTLDIREVFRAPDGDHGNVGTRM